MGSVLFVIHGDSLRLGLRLVQRHVDQAEDASGNSSKKRSEEVFWEVVGQVAVSVLESLRLEGG